MADTVVTNPIEWDDYQNFDRHEFVCKCGCGAAHMCPTFIGILQFIRERIGHPLVINSGYRCPDHNQSVSSTGSRTGPHTSGKAADIRVSGEAAYHLVRLAVRQQVTGIGIHQTGPHARRYIHLDTLTGPTRPTIWSYE